MWRVGIPKTHLYTILRVNSIAAASPHSFRAAVRPPVIRCCAGCRIVCIICRSPASVIIRRPAGPSRSCVEIS